MHYSTRELFWFMVLWFALGAICMLLFVHLAFNFNF
jgi:hypothetical protein